MPVRTLDFDSLLSDRALAIDVSGIRRVFELGAKLRNPINLSIGQPDFPVPDELKQATIRAIENNRNGYTLTQGAPELLRAIATHLKQDVNWDVPVGSRASGDEDPELRLIVTAGTSGALLLAFMALLNPGDDAIIPDPYFVIYPALARMVGANPVLCDTYPDFRMTAERIEPLITDRTKLVLVNSPANPSGVVLSEDELRDIVDLCESRGIVLITDEIYDVFTYAEAGDGRERCPSPARFSRQVLLVRGFGKSYGCTGWRMGYVAGPRAIVEQMMKLQQYTFVCAPSMAQVGLAKAFDVDLSGHVKTYRGRRDTVVEQFQGATELVRPGGAFYAFVKVPETLGMTASAFAERAVERNVLVIPGSVFSQRDTHFRLSYATPDEKLREGLTILRELMTGAGE